jgi:hypothetical protein
LNGKRVRGGIAVATFEPFYMVLLLQRRWLRRWRLLGILFGGSISFFSKQAYPLGCLCFNYCGGGGG